MYRFNMIAHVFLATGIFSGTTAAADFEPVKVTAKEMIAAYTDDSADAALKYGHSMRYKELIVTGVVAEVLDGKDGKIVRLEGVGVVVVTCLLRKEESATVKKGETISVQGVCQGYIKVNNSIDLHGAAVVKKSQ